LPLHATTHPDPETDTPYAAARLVLTLALMIVGTCGMYIVPVVLPVVQAEFGVARADAALPYSPLMIGFGIGGLIMGRLADRYGVMVPLLIGAAGLGAGFAVAGTTNSLAGFHAGSRSADRSSGKRRDVRAAHRRQSIGATKARLTEPPFSAPPALLRDPNSCSDQFSRSAPQLQAGTRTRSQ
jgi:hypothetical protein